MLAKGNNTAVTTLISPKKIGVVETSIIVSVYGTKNYCNWSQMGKSKLDKIAMLLHLEVSLSKFVGVDFDGVLIWVKILFLQGSWLVICNTMSERLEDRSGRSLRRGPSGNKWMRHQPKECLCRRVVLSLTISKSCSWLFAPIMQNGEFYWRGSRYF